MNRAGMVLLALIMLTGILSPVIAPHDPWERFGAFLEPGWGHLLGTNDMGNDILSELLYASRVSLAVGFGTAAIATILGVGIGLVSGYFRGAVDDILMGITDVFLMIPRIPLIIILIAFLKPGYGLMVLVLGFLWWTQTARVVRSKVLQVREQAFITSQKTLGFGNGRIIVSDVLPNIIHIIVPKFMLTVASAMIAESSLSFLGLGDASAKSWGMMIKYAFERGGFIQGLWWWYVVPGAAITVTVLSLVLVGFSSAEEGPEISMIPG